MLLTFLLAFAVVFGGTHAYASAHDHDGAHAGQHLASLHGDEHDADAKDADDKDAADSQGTEVAHSHVSMGAIPDSRIVDSLILKTASVLPMRNVMALPSLGIPPPLEPPLA